MLQATSRRPAIASGAEFGPVGYELNLLYIAALATLALGGASPLSFDGWIKNRKRRREQRQTRGGIP